MLDDVAQLVIHAEFRAADPVAFTHEEGEVAHMLIGLKFVALEQFAGHEIHFIVQFFVKARPIRFFALTETDTVLDAEADEVDCGVAEVAAASSDAVALWEDAGIDTGAAAHGSDFAAVVAGFVALEVEGGVDEDEIGEETLG